MTYLTSVADGIADGGSTTRDSPSLTVSGTNKVLWAFVANSDGTPATPTGVVWDPAGGAQALTLQGSGITFATYGNASLWRLIAPSDATGVVRATWAATKGERMVGAWVETDIDQTTPNGTVATNSVATDTAPVTAGAVSTSVGQRVVQFMHAFDIGGAIAAGNLVTPTGTERFDVATSGSGYDAIGAQEETASGASTTPSWATSTRTLSGWASFAFALNENAAGGGGPLVRGLTRSPLIHSRLLA